MKWVNLLRSQSCITKNNVAGSLNLLNIMREYDVAKSFSQAAVLSMGRSMMFLSLKPPLKTLLSPYATSKMIIEHMFTFAEVMI